MVSITRDNAKYVMYATSTNNPFYMDLSEKAYIQGRIINNQYYIAIHCNGLVIGINEPVITVGLDNICIRSVDDQIRGYGGIHLRIHH